MTENLTPLQMSKLYSTRAILINKANSKDIFIMFGGLKLPAQIAGSKLEFPICFSGNYQCQISWKLVERLAEGEINLIK